MLQEGPWFLNYKFLSIRRWEPNFNTKKVSLSSVAMWIRLPKLPSEYYNHTVLKKAANQIGPLIRVDDHTAVGA